MAEAGDESKGVGQEAERGRNEEEELKVKEYELEVIQRSDPAAASAAAV